MYTIGQILYGKLHHILPYKDIPIETLRAEYYAPDIVLVDLTDLDPQPQEGWNYDAETGTFSPPAGPSLSDAQDQAIANLTNAAAAAYTAGFSSEASGTAAWYDSDMATQAIISDLYTDAIAGVYEKTVYWPGQPDGLAPWTCRPNQGDPDSAKTTVWLNQDQMITLRNDYKAAWQAVKARMWEKKALVYAATTPEDALAVTWSVS